MQYLGGKERVASSLCAFMQPIVNGCPAYYELFVGGASVASRIVHSRRYLSDANPYVVVMWDAVVNRGWVPPNDLSQEQYYEIKARMDVKDPLTAFAGIGCSFGAKWFGGYARNNSLKSSSYARGSNNSTIKKARGGKPGEASRSIMRKYRGLNGAKFCVADYRDVPMLPGSFVYCDIPYDNAQKHAAVGAFDHTAFWEWARGNSMDYALFISEFEAPDDFVEVWNKPMPSGLRGKNGTTRNMCERLFVLKDSLGHRALRSE